MADTHTQQIEEIDPEILAFLLEQGMDPALYLQRREELRARTRTPEEEATLRAEQEELRPYMEFSAQLTREHGPWWDPDDVEVAQPLQRRGFIMRPEDIPPDLMDVFIQTGTDPVRFIERQKELHAERSGR